MSAETKEIIRSVVLTFLVVFVPLVLGPDFDWSWAALWAVAATALRTALSGILPGGSFGREPVSEQ